MTPLTRDKNIKDLQGVARIQRSINSKANTEMKTSVNINHGFRCFYTNAQNLGKKQKELEILIQEEDYDLTGISKLWWNDIHNLHIRTDKTNRKIEREEDHYM